MPSYSDEPLSFGFISRKRRGCGRRPSKDVQRLGGQCRILLSSVEPCTSARRQIEAEKRLAGCCPHANPRLQSSAERGFNGSEFAIQADVEVAVTAAAQSVEGDMRELDLR